MHEQASSRVRGKATLRAAAALGVAVLALVAACSLDMLGPVKPFRSIVASQDTHNAALKTVARTHGVTLAAETEQGTPSPPTIAAACVMGVTAEQADARLYDKLLRSVAGYPDIQQVFTTLRAASPDDHLPTFRRCA